jgi:hypothetical protein
VARDAAREARTRPEGAGGRDEKRRGPARRANAPAHDAGIATATTRAGDASARRGGGARGDATTDPERTRGEIAARRAAIDQLQ